MAEYSTLKVPELKKLLQEKGLPLTGNKADLVARLQQNDKKEAPEEPKPEENKEDEINYSDDEAAAAPAAEPKAEAAAAADSAAVEPAATESAEKPAEPSAEKEAEAATTEAAPEVAAQNFAMGLSSTAADDEARKRADRAKRFGIEEDDETKKRAERAKRFGIDEKELASGLDSALPERSLKRGRGRGEGDGNRPEKRQSVDRRGGGRRNNRRGPPPASNGDNRRGKPAAKSNIFDDPAEKAKAEKRAARFASS